MSRQDDFLNGDFDFDGESKDFRSTMGKVGIVIGVLLIVFNTFLLSKVIPTVINGKSFVANIERSKLYTVASYEQDGRKYTYDLDDVQVGKKQKTLRFYYKDDIKEAFAVNWKMYIISYFVYFVMIFLGVLGLKNMSVRDFINKVKSKKRSKNQSEE